MPPRAALRAPLPRRVLGPVGAASLLALALAGCGSGAVPLTFDLSAAPYQGRSGPLGRRALVVTEPVSLQPLEGDRIIVKDASGAVSFVGGGQWADRLPRLIQARVIQSLENGSRVVAIRPGDRVSADDALVMEIRDFEINAGSGEAVIEISAKIVSDRTNRVSAARVFAARAPVAAIDAGHAATALDGALATVLADMVRWIGGLAPRPTQG